MFIVEVLIKNNEANFRELVSLIILHSEKGNVLLCIN